MRCNRNSVTRTILCGGAGLILSAAIALRAADSRPVVGVGAARDAVIEAYGWPSGESKTGEREVLTYPQGQVFLTNGVVTRMEFSPTVAWPKPKPRPGQPTAVKPKPVAVLPPVADPWRASFAEASREARERSAQILVLFTGLDWSPPCKRFMAEVAQAPEFRQAVEGEFVLLHLDIPTHTAQAPEVRVQNATLRERYGVTTYPALRLLSAEGLELAQVDLEKARPEPTYVAQVIAAITEAKPKPAALVTWSERGSAAGAPPERRWLVRWSAWIERQWPLAAGLAGVVGLISWMLSRRRPAGRVETAVRAPATMPTPADITAWPTARLCDVAAALFEFEGARVQRRPAASGADLALFHPPEARPQVLVGCQAATSGLAGAKVVRELFATGVAEGVERTWFVSPGGFAPEAREFAGERGVELIGGEELLVRLKALPPLALVRVLAAGGG